MADTVNKFQNNSVYYKYNNFAAPLTKRTSRSSSTAKPPAAGDSSAPLPGPAL
jgi:hypothetical protein